MTQRRGSYISDLAFIFPVMFYYVLESLIVSVFILLVWRLTLYNTVGHLGYFQIAGAYWIIKMLLFNVFNLMAGLSTAGRNMEQEMETQEEENKSNTLTEKDFR